MFKLPWQAEQKTSLEKVVKTSVRQGSNTCLDRARVGKSTRLAKGVGLDRERKDFGDRETDDFGSGGSGIRLGDSSKKTCFHNLSFTLRFEAVQSDESWLLTTGKAHMLIKTK